MGFYKDGIVNFLPNAKATWWATPHAASRSTSAFLHRVDTIVVLSTRTGEPVVQEDLNVNYIHSYGYFEPHLNKNYFLFCSIRNPYGRFCSWWRQNSIFGKYETLISYSEYVTRHQQYTREHMNNFNIIFNILKTSTRCKKMPDQYLRQECLTEDIKKLPFVNLSNPVVNEALQQHIINNNTSLLEKKMVFNKTVANKFNNPDRINLIRPWKEYYDEELANLVYEFFKEDFKYFGYSKDSWKQGVSSAPYNPDLYR
jgi:hypothetical protein